MPAEALADAPAVRATLEDLYRVEGKAELIGGQIVHLMGRGFTPAKVMFEIAMGLHAYARQRGVGQAFPDGLIYGLRPPLPNGRESFQPDASYYVGAPPANRMKYIVGAPVFAVEVRSEHDYGRTPEREMAEKRADYFRAGTLVVWDVDPVAETVAAYPAEAPQQPTVYRPGDVAEAEPAVPGWRMAVDEIFA